MAKELTKIFDPKTEKVNYPTLATIHSRGKCQQLQIKALKVFAPGNFARFCSHIVRQQKLISLKLIIDMVL